MPPPVYVKSLFALLRALGITQQAVAQSLGVSKGLVSLWALGKTPLAKHHLRTFLTLVANAIDEAFPPAKRHYLSYDELHPSSPRRQLRHTISEHLCQWSLERYETLGLLTQDYQSAYDIIASYRGQNPAKLDSAQREKISAACRMILRVNRVLESLYQQPLESVPSDADYIPDNVLEHLWALAGWHKAWGPPPPPSDETEEPSYDA